MKTLAFDAAALGGICLIAWGLYLAWPPAAPIFIGVVVTALAIGGVFAHAAQQSARNSAQR
jgi:hypothetical protein